MSDSELMLTDDEVVALAVDRGSYWPSVLPTVDIDDGPALTSAALRGYRSLIARALLDSDGEPQAQLVEVANSIPGRTDGICVYVGDEDFQRVSMACASSHYPVENGWILEATTPLGIHSFSSHRRQLHLDYLRALLGTAIESGPPPAEGSTATQARLLCIARGTDSGAVVSAARRGEILFAHLDSDGQPKGEAEVVAGDVTAAIERLIWNPSTNPR